MPFAVTHVILTVVVVGLFRDFVLKHRFPASYVALAGLAGLLPDADLALGWVLNAVSNGSIGVEALHRLFTHSALWGLLLAVAAVVAHFALKKRSYTIFRHKLSRQHIVLFLAVMSAGWLMHISLDCALAGDERLSLIPGVPLGFCPSPLSNLSLMSLDAVILVAWLFWEQHKHRIIDYV